MISQSDRETLRSLAGRYMELAAEPVMDERRAAWRAVHDLKGTRPVILIESGWIDGFVRPEELECEDPFLRVVEQNLRTTIRHAELIGDDLIVEPYYRIGWRLELSDYGVPVEMQAPACTVGVSIGYKFNFPIDTPERIDELRPRQFRVDRERSLRFHSMLDDAFGDVLPVRLANYDPFIYEYGLEEVGDTTFVGNFFFGLMWQVYRFIGNDRLLYWVYDHPEAVHRLMRYMLDDRLALMDFLEREGLLVPNTDNQMAGPRAYGYVSDLPEPCDDRPARTRDVWGWAEAQEAEPFSPAMYGEFVLPYLAEMAQRFGLVYYGCCERVDDRIEQIIDAMPNLRSVSVSGWSDFQRMADTLGRRYVYSRKPVPAHLSGPSPNWELLESDMRDTYTAARDCNLEILYRDVYTTNGDLDRLPRWVEMTKSVFQM
jgi:hypothetical protein